MWLDLIGRFKNVFGKTIDNKIIGKINDKDNDEDDMTNTGVELKLRNI